MTQDKATANRRTLFKLTLVAFAMFGFGYALVPLYSLLCDVTGINGKTGRTDAASAETQKVDTDRWVTVEFLGSTVTGLPWDFGPDQYKLRLHPGQTAVAYYTATNTSKDTITGQAIPSVSPGRAAPYFKKIECFCFSQQTLAPGETRRMPVRFVVENKLAPEVDTITLSYAFFNTDKASAAKYNGQALAANDGEAHHHAEHHAHGG